MDTIADPEALRGHYGTVHPLAVQKVLPVLDRYAREFIALSPFFVLATTDGAGGVDASPRGDPPGAVRVVDDTTLLIADRPGNNRVDSFGNIVANASVGLLFFVPGVNETLRVNGTARIETDAALLATLAEHGKPARAALRVAVTEMFFHCGKALIRSRLWDAETRIPRDHFPSLGRIVADQTRAVAVGPAEELVEKAYRDNLY